MSERIFISYRRADAQWAVDSIYAKLAARFSDEEIFMDVENIPLGVNFQNFIDQQIISCDIMLVVVGQDWIDAVDEDGNRRLDNSSDFVRVEIESALENKKLIIPLFLDGVKNIPAKKLPESIKELSLLNGIQIRRGRIKLEADIEQLAISIENYFAKMDSAIASEKKSSFWESFRKTDNNLQPEPVGAPEEHPGSDDIVGSSPNPPIGTVESKQDNSKILIATLLIVVVGAVLFGLYQIFLVENPKPVPTAVVTEISITDTPVIDIEAIRIEAQQAFDEGDYAVVANLLNDHEINLSVADEILLNCSQLFLVSSQSERDVLLTHLLADYNHEEIETECKDSAENLYFLASKLSASLKEIDVLDELKSGFELSEDTYVHGVSQNVGTKESPRHVFYWLPEGNWNIYGWGEYSNLEINQLVLPAFSEILSSNLKFASFYIYASFDPLVEDSTFSITLLYSDEETLNISLLGDESDKMHLLINDEVVCSDLALITSVSVDFSNFREVIYKADSGFDGNIECQGSIEYVGVVQDVLMSLNHNETRIGLFDIVMSVFTE